MKKYLLLLKDRDYCSKVIASANKNDLVFLLYSKNNGQISVSDFQLFANAKCKIQFLEIPGEVPENVGLAFMVGLTIGKHNDVVIKTETPMINSLLTVNGSKPTAKRTRKPRESAKETVKEAKPATTVPKAKEEKTVSAANKPTRRRKPAVSESEFDAAYEELNRYLTSLKTNKCDPSANINAIVKAVVTMEEEKTTFDDAISLYVSPSTAKKLMAIPQNALPEIIKRAKRLHSLDK